ncbi:MAG: carboxymuconolactone decarboxylase family protein [Acidimicrobiia bacterium]
MAQQGVTEEMYAHVAEYRERDDYSERERLAIEYAERLALDHTNFDDDFWRRMRAGYSDEEIVDLSLCIMTFIGLGRMLAVLGVDPACALDW